MPPVGKEIPTGGPKRRETILFYQIRHPCHTCPNLDPSGRRIDRRRGRRLSSSDECDTYPRSPVASPQVEDFSHPSLRFGLSRDER